MKTVLMYFLLIILVFLLFLPPGLRLFMTSEEEEDEKAKDMLVSLNCKRGNETLDMNYLGKNPQSLFYRLSGDKSFISAEDLLTEENQLIRDFYPVAITSYSESSDVTLYSIKYTVYELNYETMTNYILPVSQQQSYFTKLGFSCTTEEI